MIPAALLPGLARDASYRFREEKDARGWAIESREAWGAVVGHVAIFEPALIQALHVANGLMRSRGCWRPAARWRSKGRG